MARWAAMSTSDTSPLDGGEVAAWRGRFPILARCTYLINNSLGAMPATVPEALAGFADEWGTDGVEAWSRSWLPRVTAVGDLLASLLGAPAGSVTVHQNVATLAAMVTGALDFSGRRNRIVVTDAEWPGHHYLADRHRRDGAELVVVPTDGVTVDVARLCAAIDERTAVVPLSHVLFRSAAITDVAAVCEHARRVGAVTLVDGYHAVGAIPVDVTAIGCDFYTGGSVKWLCGGPGVAYLYVAEEAAGRLGSRAVGWLGHARPFDFDLEWEAAAGAPGWLGGTPAMPALTAAQEGYRVLAEVGPARVRATSRTLTAHLVEGALERGLTVRSPLDADARAGAVTIDVGRDERAVARELGDLGIVVDARPGAGIRVGPHFFNTAEECDRLLDAVGGAP